jgi:hypothetical protein
MNWGILDLTVLAGSLAQPSQRQMVTQRARRVPIDGFICDDQSASAEKIVEFAGVLPPRKIPPGPDRNQNRDDRPAAFRLSIVFKIIQSPNRARRSS